MRILFIHPKFPGPFRYLAQDLAVIPNNKVLFLTETIRPELRLNKVKRLTIPTNIKDSASKDLAEQEIVQTLSKASNTANILLRLQNNGFYPDIICGSPQGHSLYVRDIFPDAFYVVYANWFYTKGENYNFFHQNRPPVDFAPARMRNLLQWNTLSECDLAITSTQWQKEQYPETLASKITVLPEGINTDFFKPSKSTLTIPGWMTKPKELVTFFALGSEMLRGLPQFYQCLPELLLNRPQCQVILLTSDPNSSLLTTLRNQYPVDQARVQILTYSTLDDYCKILQASTVHVYFTAPFALSANLLEALSCGCLVMGSNTAPVQEIIQPGQNGFLCDFWEPNLAQLIANTLEQADKLIPVRQAARQTILDHYDLKQQSPKLIQLLSNSYNQTQ